MAYSRVAEPPVAAVAQRSSRTTSLHTASETTPCTALGTGGRCARTRSCAASGSKRVCRRSASMDRLWTAQVTRGLTAAVPWLAVRPTRPEVPGRTRCQPATCDDARREPQVGIETLQVALSGATRQRSLSAELTDV